MFSLEGKVALVTGGSRGIGRAISLMFAKQGAKVIVNYAGNQAAAESLIQEITALGKTAKAMKFDVGDEKEVADAIESIGKEWGTLDILVNNAGVSYDQLLLRVGKEDLDRTLQVNLYGAVFCSKNAIRLMMKKKKSTVNKWAKKEQA